MRRNFMRASVALLTALLATVLVGCGPAPVEYVEITPDQTAFSVPLQGDREGQEQLLTEKYLDENKVSAKRYKVPYVWVKTRFFGTWKKGAELIVVDLKPSTRAWTAPSDTGTAANNQALVAETRDSIGFSAEMNCSAAVNEANAAKYVHAYYKKPLEEVIDVYVRPYAQQIFTETCAQYYLDDRYNDRGRLTDKGLLTHKAEIMNEVRKKTTEYFAARGIDILSLGMQGELTYLNKDIQTSIDKRIQSKNDYEAQKFQNQKRIETAAAANREASLLSGPTAIKLRQLEIDRLKAEAQKTAAEKWDGKLPVTMVPGGGVPLVNVGK